MNIAASATLALVLGGVYQKRGTAAYMVVGALLGSVLATAVSICLNFVVTPMYTSGTYEQVTALVVPYLLPFNLAKAALNALVAMLLHRSLHNLLSGTAETGDDAGGVRP